VLTSTSKPLVKPSDGAFSNCAMPKSTISAPMRKVWLESSSPLMSPVSSMSASPSCRSMRVARKAPGLSTKPLTSTMSPVASVARVVPSNTVVESTKTV
jgi:hypothetical protein